MLVELLIRDFALIDELKLGFGPGLNAITGETGSGKSLLVGSLEALLGQRPKGGPADWVRRGAKSARVEGRFALVDGPLADRVGTWLAEHLPEIPAEWEEDEEERELVLSRTLGLDGRTKAYVNHRSVTRRALSGLATMLFEIHGQNEHQRLLEPSEQLRLVDAMGEHGALLDKYRRARTDWREAVEHARELEASQAERRRRLIDLRFQNEELENAGLSTGERAELGDERQLLRAAEELGRELSGVIDSLSEADGAAVERLRNADRLLDRWRDRIGALSDPHSSLRDALVHLEDACMALVSFADGVESNPARLEQVESRLAELDRLERKYSADEHQLIVIAEELKQEIEALEQTEESREGASDEIDGLRKELDKRSLALSKARGKLGPRMCKSVMTALGDLGMDAARFEVEIQKREAEAEDTLELGLFGASGVDRVEFMLGANPGEPVRPLRYVASGGEAARIMLALRSVLSVGPAPAGRGERTLVFDEIDSGVGGHLAPKVAKHLRTLAIGDQVLCVTHLPAIAAAADMHLKVAKEAKGERWHTVVAELEGEERVLEVADMIGGGAGHKTARAEARRLLGRD